MIKFRHSHTTKDLQDSEVLVYFNLNNRCYSIKATSGPNKGKVVAHISLDHNFILKDAKFISNDSGRERVRLEQTKNVHAYIRGTYSEVLWSKVLELEKDTKEVTYNPYIYDNFVLVDNGEGIFHNDEVIFTRGKILIGENK